MTDDIALRAATFRDLDFVQLLSRQAFAGYGDYSGVLPDKITIFLHPCEDEAEDESRLLRDIVREVVWHEVAHLLGLDEERTRLLVAACALTLAQFAGELGFPLPEPIASWSYPAIQPLGRALIGVWLWRESRMA